MKLRGRSPRVALAVLAALLAALVVSACGGSSNSGSSSKSASSKNASATTTNASTSTTASARTAFTTCLKQHGVTAGNGLRGGFGGRRNGTGTGTIPKITANGTSTTQGGAGAPGAGFPGAGSGAPSGAANGDGGFPGGGGAGFAGGNSKFAKAFQACRSKLGSAGLGAGRFQGGPGGGNARPHFSTTALKSYVSCIRKNGYAAMPEPKASSGGSFFPASVEKNAKFQAANKKCQSILLKAFRRPAGGTGSGGGTYTITGSSTTSST